MYKYKLFSHGHPKASTQRLFQMIELMVRRFQHVRVRSACVYLRHKLHQLVVRRKPAAAILPRAALTAPAESPNRLPEPQA